MSEQLIIFSQIVFIDLILAGDNAIIIGMVASKFPLEQRRKIIFWGIGGAVILRIILTLLTAYLLQITGLRLLGGLLLLCIVLYFIYKTSNRQRSVEKFTVSNVLTMKPEYNSSNNANSNLPGSTSNPLGYVLYKLFIVNYNFVVMTHLNHVNNQFLC